MSSGEPEKISIEIDDDCNIEELLIAFSRLALALGYSPENIKDEFFNGEDLL